MTGRARLVRSILHKPVFMTISTALGVWVAITMGVVYQFDGFARVPGELAWFLYPSLLAAPAFGLFVVLNDEDRLEQSVQAPTKPLLAKRSSVPPAGRGQR